MIGALQAALTDALAQLAHLQAQVRHVVLRFYCLDRNLRSQS